MEAERCRLCGSESDRIFTLPVLDKYDVGYFECRTCGSVETEPPYWLSEVYIEDVHPTDADYLNRNLYVFKHALFLLKVLKIDRSATVLDYGGGLGLVARFLRESGWNAFCHDTYTKSPFPDVAWDNTPPTFVTAIELFEHLTDPQAEMEKLFAGDPDYVYVRTCRYEGQGQDWTYLGPSHGQHVFFYTDKAMRHIARTYGHEVLLLDDGATLFHKKPLSAIQKLLISRGLRSGMVRRAFDIGRRVTGRS